MGDREGKGRDGRTGGQKGVEVLVLEREDVLLDSGTATFSVRQVRAPSFKDLGSSSGAGVKGSCR